MKLTQSILLSAILFPMSLWAKESLYCPQGEGYIRVGMTEDQVTRACGQPISKRQPNRPVTKKVPVKQYVYTTLNKGNKVYPTLDPIYNMWSLPSGSKGVSLDIDVVNGKISDIRINGKSSNATSLCQSTPIKIGDPENVITNACGGPQYVNNTFSSQVVPSNDKPEVWVYQSDQYQAPITLTFSDGKLQSID